MKLYFQLFYESILFAFQELISNRLRTFLSLLGVSIGIFSIISVFTLVDSLERKVKTSVSSLGSDVIFVQKWPWDFGSDYPWWKYWQRPLPKLQERLELEKRLTLAQSVSFMANTKKTVNKENLVLENVPVVAVSVNYDRVKKIKLASGRYFADIELKNGKNFVLIGANIAQSFFPNESALSKSIKVFGRKYIVIGVMQREGQSMFGESADDQIIVSINNAVSFIDLSKESTDPTLMIQAKSGVSNTQLKDEIDGIMRALRKIKPQADPNYALNETSLLATGFNDLFRVINTAGAVIGLFSIVVGGFGIANIMFVSVKERTSIIGIQKSLGAKNSFVLFQFLSESVILCLVGGLLGLALVYFITIVLSHVIDFDLIVSFKNLIIGLIISLGIGLISGILPAYFASRLNPVDAIRTNM